MSSVSNGPSSWAISVSDYCAVASSTAVIYDWALTIGQEFELVWMQRWSFMTALYLGVRYIGMFYSGITLVSSLPSLSMTDTGCAILGFVQWRSFLVINAILGVIMITRLHAMYQRSRKMLIFLVVVLLVITIACVVIVVMQSIHISWHEVVSSGTYHCSAQGGDPILIAKSWILTTVWEVLALCLAIWIAVKHFRELQRSPTGTTIRDCFTVLIKAHVLYFAAFVAVSCFNLGLLSPGVISESFPGGLEVYNGILGIISLVQMFVLGPRLVLSIREYHAMLVATSDEGTCMTTIAFRECLQVSTGSTGDV